MNPPANIDIVRLLFEEMQKWKPTPTEQQSQRQFTELSDRLINYFHIHYATPALAPTGLPGLPGSPPIQ